MTIMLPPVDKIVLEKNPKFASLHSLLTGKLLNPDGSTKSHSEQKQRDEMTQALKAGQKRALKTQLLKSALSKLDIPPPETSSKSRISSSPSLSKQPSDPFETIILLSNRLSTESYLSPSATEILENTPQWLALPSLLPTIGKHLSAHLHTQALALCSILNPSTNPSNLDRLIPKLVTNIQGRQSIIEKKQQNLDSRREELLEKVKTLLSLYHLASTLVILHLEQTVHGSLTRELKTKSEFLSLVAERLALEAKEKRLKGEKIFYSDAVKSSFKVYAGLIRKAREHLEERKMKAEKTLLGYGVGDSNTQEARFWRNIADKYAALQKELNDVRGDVEKLTEKTKKGK